jgi:WD40 repeat protein
MVSGSADNEMRLWNVATGKCLYVWEFPTAVKWVAFSEEDDQVVCITEQRMGHQGAIRVFDINRDGDGTKRESILSTSLVPCCSLLPILLPIHGMIFSSLRAVVTGVL